METFLCWQQNRMSKQKKEENHTKEISFKTSIQQFKDFILLV